jgi:copper(I)-binding protein
MRRVIPRLASLPFAVTFVVALVATSGAQEFKAGSIVIEQPWARATPAGAKVGGGYMTIVNTGKEPDRLIGGSLPRADGFQLHEMKMDGDTMKMREKAEGLEIKPGQKLKLRPARTHVMFMNLKEPLRQGETLKGQLRFEKAGTVDIQYKVEGLGAQTTGHGGH